MSRLVDHSPKPPSHSDQRESPDISLAASGMAPATIRKQISEASHSRTHNLKPGETIWGFAQEAGLDYKAILKLNGLTESSARSLPDGLTLKLPISPAARSAESRSHIARTHEVKPGETIYGIAREYGIPYRDILKLNGLTDVSARRIREGTQLRLVGDAGQTPPVDTDRDFNVTDKTRDEISRRSKPGARLVSLDFNDARSPHAKGIEIVIPDNATQEERSAAEAYVKGVQAFFRHHGLERDIRGVHVRSDVGRGIPGIIHTEPFFLKDKAALRAIQKDPEGYIKVLADTLGTIDGVTFMPPHKRNDPGASQGSLNERDFAKRTLIPLLKKMALA